MWLNQQQFAVRTSDALLPCYVVSGDEPLLVQEVVDQLRAAAEVQGYDSRQLYHVDSGFDWQLVASATDSLSLFSSRRIFELRFDKATPGEAGAKVLRELAARPPTDVLLILLMPKLDAKAKSAAWLKALDAIGAIIQVWPLERQQLPQWLSQRMRRLGLSADDAAVRLLADYVEGNLLAAAQELEKLRLLQDDGRVTQALVEQCLADNARYDVFGLIDAALAGDAARVQRIVGALRQEGVAETLLLWGLARELRLLARIARRVGPGGGLDASLARSFGVWPKRVALVNGALRRYRYERWLQLLRRAASVDRVIKGMAVGSGWDELLQLALAMAGASAWRADNRLG